ncbi:BTAD domain-containing putative transcriptional regulator [Streptomyces naphthomycinicus]|uniref:BTAD domain-containing putative transcriptional regulator n=1 Tax=Streptomyces naphthomycinicus TaxID=2872625 RepID=UPI00288A276A|nr:BTAD domain-containing putative transcriptional regulator [Streptomyces sp. TML10]
MPTPDSDVGAIIKNARNDSGLSQRVVAHRAGISLRALREIEQGRVRSPRKSSLRRLIEVLGLAQHPDLVAGPVAAQGEPGAEDEPLVLRVLGGLSASRGQVRVPLGTPKQQALLGLLALRANEVAERDEIVGFLWGDDIPDSFDQLVHTYVYRIRQILKTHDSAEGGGMALLRRATGYELQADEDQLDLLRFRRLGAKAQQAQGADQAGTEFSLLGEMLELWRGNVLEGVSPSLYSHPVAVAASAQRIGAALRFAEIGNCLEEYGEVIEKTGPVALGSPLHEGLHAGLITALAGAGQRAEALELFTTIDMRLRRQSGIGAGVQLREAQAAILRADSDTGGAAPAVPAMAPPDTSRLPYAAGTFVDRPELHRTVQYLSRNGEAAEPEAPSVVALHGPAGAGKTATAARAVGFLRPHFGDSVFRAEMASGSPEEIHVLLDGFLRTMGIPAHAVPAGAGERVEMYQTVLRERSVLVVLDNVTQAQSIRPLLPSGTTSALLVTSRTPLPDLGDGVRHIRIPALRRRQSLELLSNLIGEDRVLREREAADRLASLCGDLPLAVRIAGLRLAARPHWELAGFAECLSTEERRLPELALGDVRVRDRLDSVVLSLGPRLRQALQVLAEEAGPFTLTRAAGRLKCPAREAEELLEALVSEQVLERPPRPGGEYFFLPLTRVHLRGLRPPHTPAVAKRVPRPRRTGMRYAAAAGRAVT